jgi:hypothetical protein
MDEVTVVLWLACEHIEREFIAGGDRRYSSSFSAERRPTS